jgi:argininosuccinate synthase
MALKDIIAKVDAAEVPVVKKVALAYSGGLDSSLAVELLRRKYKAKKIVPITVDVGQGKEEIAEGNAKAKVLKVKPLLIDAKKEFSEEWLTRAIRANSDYNGYPVSTSMTRQLVARIVALKARSLGCDAVLEGSTGKGNDQYRMHNVFKMFAPELDVLVPVRDFDLQRAEEEKLCKAWGVPVNEILTGGDDKTMWCRSIASGAIDLNQKLPDKIWMWLVPPEKAKARGDTVTVEFEQGLPTKLDGRRVNLDTMIERLNVIAGRNGVGKIDMFEDGIMGLKSREIYEAPAAHVILKLHRDLEAQCLTKEEIHFKKIVEDRWAMMVYHGEWYHPLRVALDAFIESTQRPVNGRFKVKFYKGNIDIVERYSDTSLFSREIRSLKATAFDQRQCKDAAKIRGLIFELLAKRDEKVK